MTTVPLPDPATLSSMQLSEQACALCGARLYRDQLLGKVTYRDHYGRKVKAELWVCAPECPSRPGGPGQRARY